VYDMWVCMVEWALTKAFWQRSAGRRIAPKEGWSCRQRQWTLSLHPCVELRLRRPFPWPSSSSGSWLSGSGARASPALSHLASVLPIPTPPPCCALSLVILLSALRCPHPGSMQQELHPTGRVRGRFRLAAQEPAPGTAASALPPPLLLCCGMLWDRACDGHMCFVAAHVTARFTRAGPRREPRCEGI
jgi:hypothetical protein